MTSTTQKTTGIETYNSLTAIGLILDLGLANIYYISTKPNILPYIKLILIFLKPYKSIGFIFGKGCKYQLNSYFCLSNKTINA
jgi:hypothetical protein